MSFRDILVQVDETPTSRLRAQAAAELARRFDAHLGGVFLTNETPLEFLADESFVAFKPGLIEQIMDDHRKALETRGETARQQFEAVAAEAGVKSDWSILRGETPGPLTACARRADLTVLPGVVRPCLGRNTLSVAELALAAGGPLLLTPDDDFAPPVGKRILVAWNGGREAARALRDAWPLIARAEEVHVLVVSPRGEVGPDGMLQRHFERHGCAANLIVDPSHDEAAADVLQRQAAELGADLVVMGVYGRPRLQEFVLGGVSRRMLGDLPVPLFVSH